MWPIINLSTLIELGDVSAPEGLVVYDHLLNFV